MKRESYTLTLLLSLMLLTTAITLGSAIPASGANGIQIFCVVVSSITGILGSILSIGGSFGVFE